MGIVNALRSYFLMFNPFFFSSRLFLAPKLLFFADKRDVFNCSMGAVAVFVLESLLISRFLTLVLGEIFSNGHFLH
jgi:hypothetical protein